MRNEGVNAAHKRARIVNRTAGSGRVVSQAAVSRWPGRGGGASGRSLSVLSPVRGGNRTASELRIAGSRVGGASVRERPKSVGEWKREIASVVSSFEGAS